jgi:UDP-glucose:(heptosyl)LPS alpha-1,3-glucosyltransferase
VRIAAVIDRLRPGKGGLEVFLERLLGHLLGKGHEVHTVSQDADGPPGAVHHQVAVRGIGRARRDRRFAERCRDLCREEGFDTVLGFRHLLACDVYAPHGGSVAAAFEAHREAKRLPSFPSAKVRNFHALERGLLSGPRPPRDVIAVSEQVRRDLAERYPAIAGRIRVVPNGVDLDRFRPDGREADRRELGVEGCTVLFLASNPRLKGWEFARAAFERLRERGAADTLLVAGGNPGLLPEGARYLGRVDRVEPVLRAADVLLSPTWFDPFPLAVLEALACGTPVVTTERNGALDHVGRDGPVRAAVEPPDVEGLVAHTAALIDEAPRDAARRVAEEFPLARCLDSTEAILAERPVE